ncbi:hypothetical protein [Natronoglomus mannanivorans]|uniref:Uncharacterized protein n=1 Tax=Natronoglomus mannanivorans TaxID=2979990 RepID=A0AAP2YYE2_9EURY|nr:hypothetical protein [Halobacteria archaeon AArc-xg1-1]
MSDELDSDADGSDRGDRERADHLADLPDGAGCTEIWEHLEGGRGMVNTGDKEGTTDTERTGDE